MRVRPVPSHRARSAPFGDAEEAMHALRRLMDAATEAESPSALAAGLLREARAFFRADRAVMLGIAEPVGNVYVSATDPVGGSRPDILKLADLAPVAELLRTSDGALQLDGRAASELAASIGVGPEVRSML